VWLLFHETFGLSSNPEIIRKVIPTFASDPGPKKSGVLYRKPNVHAIRKLGFFDWNSTCVKLENWSYILELDVHRIKKPMEKYGAHIVTI
jgi:hypothetical protein